MGLGVIGPEPDRLAVCGDGLVELSLGLEADAEVDVGRDEVGLEPDRLAVLGDGLVELPLRRQAVTKIVVSLRRSRA